MKFFTNKIRSIFRFGDFPISILIFLLGLSLYTVTLRGVYGNIKGEDIKNHYDQATQPFGLSPERDRYLLTYSLAEDHSFSLSLPLANAAMPDDGYYKGKVYIFFAPGISLFALPFYLIGRMYHLAQVGAFFFISLIASFTLVFLYKIARNVFGMPVWAALMAPLTFGFASSSWNYAITLYQHHVTTFFIIASFYAVWKFKQQKKFSWLWAIVPWINYALAFLIDYPNALLVMPVMVYFFFSALRVIQEKTSITFSLRKAFLWTMIPFILLMGLHGYYNQTHYGSWKTLAGSLADYKDIKDKKLLTQKNGQQVIENIQNAKTPIGFFKEENTTNGLYILLLSDQRGLFFYSPVLLLGLLGIVSTFRRMSIEIAVLIASIAIDIFLYSSFGDPWGGWAFGPRYLIPSMAVLALFVSIFLTSYGKRIYVRLLTFLLLAYSVAISLVGALTTNSLPPKGEADLLKIPHTYQWNFYFWEHGASSSFLYNVFFSHYISLLGFSVVLYEIILACAVVMLFILPAKKKL